MTKIPATAHTSVWDHAVHSSFDRRARAVSYAAPIAVCAVSCPVAPPAPVPLVIAP